MSLRSGQAWLHRALSDRSGSIIIDITAFLFTKPGDRPTLGLARHAELDCATVGGRIDSELCIVGHGRGEFLNAPPFPLPTIIPGDGLRARPRSQVSTDDSRSLHRRCCGAGHAAAARLYILWSRAAIGDAHRARTPTSTVCRQHSRSYVRLGRVGQPKLSQPRQRYAAGAALLHHGRHVEETAG